MGWQIGVTIRAYSARTEPSDDAVFCVWHECEECMDSRL